MALRIFAAVLLISMVSGCALIREHGGLIAKGAVWLVGKLAEKAPQEDKQQEEGSSTAITALEIPLQ